MLIFRTAKGLQAHLKGNKKNLKLALVPTMGYLHNGHLKLIQEAKKIADLVCVSIYVNPTQFNNLEDLEKYPRNQEADIEKLKKEGVDFVFIPKDQEIYPKGLKPKLLFESSLFFSLEGECRPGHFAGVCMVVKKLLKITSPEVLVLGQKDLQQSIVIKEMIKFYDFQTRVKIVQTVRSRDGLALSSRNSRLSPKQRKVSLVLSQTIFQAEKDIRNLLEQNLDKAIFIKKIYDLEKKYYNKVLNTKGFKVEYFRITDARKLEKLVKVDKDTEIAILIAGFVGKIRLIDNTVVKTNVYF
jgi:pantoate--beta-alanine ligase